MVEYSRALLAHEPAATAAQAKATDADPVSATLIDLFVDASGELGPSALEKLQAFLQHAGGVTSRIQLLLAFDNCWFSHEETALDRLRAKPARSDQTWKDGGRPANMAIALDDLSVAIARLAATEAMSNAGAEL